MVKVEAGVDLPEVDFFGLDSPAWHVVKGVSAEGSKGPVGRGAGGIARRDRPWCNLESSSLLGCVVQWSLALSSLVCQSIASGRRWL